MPRCSAFLAVLDDLFPLYTAGIKNRYALDSDTNKNIFNLQPSSPNSEYMSLKHHLRRFVVLEKLTYGQQTPTSFDSYLCSYSQADDS